MQAPNPFVTVIMPIRNEADFIDRSLGAVLAQDYPADRLEVLVADGMSDDDTRQLIAQLAGASPIPVTVIDNPGRIVPTGFNRALTQARGDVIVRVDGHTIIAPDYVSRCVAALERTGADNVGGRMDAIGRGDEWSEAIARATSSPFGVGGARFHYATAEAIVDTVYMGAWRRATFERIGGFDEDLMRNQDDEFNYRLRAAGGTIMLDPTIRSDYYSRATPERLAKQYYQYGVYKIRVMQKHPAQMRPRQFVPFAFVGALAVTLIGGLLIPPLLLAFIAVVLLYEAANLIAALLIARGDIELLVRVQLIFLILHASYGAGFWVGLWRFRDRWGDRAGSVPTISPRGASA